MRGSIHSVVVLQHTLKRTCVSGVDWYARRNFSRGEVASKKISYFEPMVIFGILDTILILTACSSHHKELGGGGAARSPRGVRLKLL